MAVRAEAELGDLLSVGEAAAQGAEDTLRAGADEAHAADAVASEAGAAGRASASGMATEGEPSGAGGAFGVQAPQAAAATPAIQTVARALDDTMVAS